MTPTPLKKAIVSATCVWLAACNGESQFKGSGSPGQSDANRPHTGAADAVTKTTDSAELPPEGASSGAASDPNDGANGGSASQPDSVNSGAADGTDGVDGARTTDMNGADGTIAVRGKSLDLHAVFDVSGSLARTDSQCLRFAAFQDFRAALKEKLGAEGDVRVTMITFSDEAKTVGTVEKALQLSDQEFDEHYRDEICRIKSNTVPSPALGLTAEIAGNLIASSPKQIVSFLFFSDGVPTLQSRRGMFAKSDSLDAIVSATAKLREIFKLRMFSILLGTATLNEQCPRNTNDAQCPTPLKFVTDIAGSADRVRNAEEADALKDSLLSFLK